MLWRDISEGEPAASGIAQWTELPGGAAVGEVLACNPYATLPEVRSAYRALARRLHPDVVAPELRESAGRAMATLNAEYRARIRQL